MKVNTLLNLAVVFLLSWLLSACLEVGTNEGDSEITLNASILKGRLSGAEVQVQDNDGNILWEGFSDENGNIDINFRGANDEALTIIAQPSWNSLLLCDATQCQQPQSNKLVDFGETIALDPTSDIRLSSTFHTQGVGSDSDIQISGITQLTTEWLNANAPSNFKASPDLHDLYAQLVSQLLTTTLGLDIPETVNLLDLSLVDINDDPQFQNRGVNTSVLSLINASLSSDIDQVNAYTTALQQLTEAPDSPATQQSFEAVQKNLLSETQKVSQLPGLTGLDTDAIDQIEKAATEPLDFEAINARLSEAMRGVEEPDDLTAPRVTKLAASSSHWRPEVGNMRTNSWWWVSPEESGDSEWLRMDFAHDTKFDYLMLGVDSQFRGFNLRLEGRNPEDSEWTVLIPDLSHILEQQGVVDPTNVIRLAVPIQQEEGAQFQSLRLYSAPSQALWLEYFCVFSNIPVPGSDCFSQERLVPEHITTSSLKFEANNVASNVDSWISQMARNAPEWLEVRYSQPVLASSVTLSAKASFLGTKPIIQGRNEDENWETLLALDVGFLQSQSDEDGYVNVTLPLATQTAYQAYRYYSEPSPFVWLTRFTFNIEED